MWLSMWSELGICEGPVAAPSVRCNRRANAHHGHAALAGAALAADDPKPGKRDRNIGKWTNAFRWAESGQMRTTAFLLRIHLRSCLCVCMIGSTTRLLRSVWRAKHRRPSGNKRPTPRLQRRSSLGLCTSCGSGPVSPSMVSLNFFTRRAMARRTTGGEWISRANAAIEHSLRPPTPDNSAVLPTGGPTSDSRV